MLDLTTRITYDESLNPVLSKYEDVENDTLSTTTSRVSVNNSILGLVEEGDSLVLMGNLWDPQRQNAVYITSTDDGAPFIDVLSDLNRPDYSVLYFLPVYKFVKLHKKGSISIPGKTNDDIPYTGNYYLLNGNINAQYALADIDYNGATYKNLFYDLSKRYISLGAYNIRYLSSSPNSNTALDTAETFGNFLTEDGDTLTNESDTLILEEVLYGLRSNSTKTTKVRIGKLDGILDEHFPSDKLPYGYGLYGSNVFLVGEFYLNNGRSLAEISEEAITFASAARDAAINEAELIRRDSALVEKRLDTAILRLRNNVYTKNTLLSAGIKIKDNVLGIWGGSILMFTTYDELYGWSNPTALFENGKILGKFLGVDEAHSNMIAPLGDTTFVYNDITYTSSDPFVSGGSCGVRVFRDKEEFPWGSGNYVKTTNCKYIRRFHDGTSYKWIVVNPDGYPPKNGNNYNVEFLSFTILETGDYITGGNLTSEQEQYLIEEYSESLKLWGFEKDGKGNVGGTTLYWNNTGKVVVNGTIYSTEGNIGGFTLSNNSLYLKKNPEYPSDLILSNSGYKWKDGDASFPYMQLNSINTQGLIEFSTIYTSRGFYYQGKGGMIMQTPGMVFLLTVIPIMYNNGNTWGLYARLSGKGAMSVIKMAFDDGVFLINLPRLQESIYADLADWFVRSYLRGDIFFYATGHNFAATELQWNDTNAYAFNPNRIDQYHSYLLWTNDMHDKRKVMHNHASVDQFGFISNNYNFNSYGIGSGGPLPTSLHFGAIIGQPIVGGTLPQSESIGGLVLIGRSEDMFSNDTWNNVIVMSTAANEDVNYGGFTLCCMYSPGFDEREGAIAEGSAYTPEEAQEYAELRELRLLIIDLYGASGTRYTEVVAARNLLINNLTSELLTTYSSELQAISSAISSMSNIGAEVSNTLNTFTTSELNSKKSACDGYYTIINSNIATIQSGTQQDASCVCNIRSKYPNESNKYSSDSSEDDVLVATYTPTDCDLTFKYCLINPDETDGYEDSILTLSNIRGTGGNIYATVAANPTNQSYVYYYMNCKDSNGNYDYFRFRLSGGGSSGGGGGESGGGESGGTDESLETLLPTFNTSSLFNSLITAGTDLYDFLANSLSTANSMKSDYSVFTITNGPITFLNTGYNDDAFQGFFMGMLLTALFPFTGSGSVNYSNVNRRNSDVLAAAHQTYGARLNDSVSTYVSKYKGELLASIVFAKMIATPSFRTSFKNIKNNVSISGYTNWFSFCDKDLFSLTEIAPNGRDIFDYPLSNSYVNSTISEVSNLGERDEVYYRNGKTARKTDGSYDNTDGGIANNDTSHVNNYPNNGSNRIGYFLDIYATATNNAVNVSTPSSVSYGYYTEGDSRNWQDPDSNGDHPGLTGLSYNYKTYAKYCLMDMSYKPARDTVNNTKNTSTSSNWYRVRPFTAHSDDSPMTYANGDDDIGNTNATSYPSGHSGYAWGMALAYTTLSSSFTSSNINSLFARAYKFGLSRVIVGAHWQSDVEVGRLAAACSFALMCGNKLFINQIDLAQ